jgi:hypothetical protein
MALKGREGLKATVINQWNKPRVRGVERDFRVGPAIRSSQLEGPARQQRVPKRVRSLKTPSYFT